MRCCGISCSAARNSTGRVSNSPSFRRSNHVRVQAGWSYRHRPWLANQCIVIGMRSDPEPEHTIRNIHTEGPVVIANAHGAKTRDVLEIPRGVGPARATPRSTARTQRTRDASKRSRLPVAMLAQRCLCQGVKLAGLRVSGELIVPDRGVEVDKPPPEFGELGRGQRLDVML